MRVCFFRSDKPREGILADAFMEGVKKHGDIASIRMLGDEDESDHCDVAVMVGVKSKRLFDKHINAGRHVIYLDKGYSRHVSEDSAVRIWEYWRVSVDSHHPTRYLMLKQMPHDRIDAFGLDLPLPPLRKGGNLSHIVIAGSSAKYHEFYGMKPPNEYYKKVFKQIREKSAQPVIYRPKPSYHDAESIPGTITSPSRESIYDVLDGAHALVTHGSNACFEAVITGVPCIILGDAVAKPISSTDLKFIRSPKLASEEDRMQWLANLSYQQWTMPEMKNGKAWDHIRPMIFGEFR